MNRNAMSASTALGLLAMGLAMTAGSARAEIIHVPEDYAKIQWAINASQDGDEIVVAPGVYPERIHLSDRAITVRSADPDDRSVVQATIIDGEGNGTVIDCDGHDGWPAFTISGFTITNGWNYDGGGGMYNEDCTPTVTKCIFENNMAYWGGGGMYNVVASLTITDCTFINNSDHYYSGEGGAMWNVASDVTVTRCRFIANFAEIGGAISSSSESTVTLTDCMFIRNSADYGAGAFDDESCSVVVMNCTFCGNSAWWAGGLFTGCESATVMNCTFSGNVASGRGGGLFGGFDLAVANCTFIGNVAGQGGAMYFFPGDPNLAASNCIFWGNQAAEGSQIFDNGTNPQVTYSCIQDGYPGLGNIDVDPLLQRPPDPGPDGVWGTDDDDYGDLHVVVGSPCIDAADNTAVPPDVLDLDEDGDTDEPTPLDMDHFDRFVDDLYTPDTGYGDPPLVDMGAFEFQADFTGLCVIPPSGFESSGPAGGPFEPESKIYTLRNYSDNPLEFSVWTGETWLGVNPDSGVIDVQGAAQVTAYVAEDASTLPHGTYDDVLQFVNETNHEGDTTRPARLEVGVPVPVYCFPMDVDPGWSVEGLWAFGQPTGGGGEMGGPDPTGGYTGPYVYGYNLDGDYENGLPPRHLTSTPLDCSRLTQVQLKFWRWLGVGEPAIDHAYIYISTDAVNWIRIWTNQEEIADDEWQLQERDISDYADNQPEVYLRWTMGPTAPYWPYCGWNIDDVELWGVEAMQQCPADFDGDGDVDTADLLFLLGAWGTPDGDVDGDGDTDTADLLALLGAWGPCPPAGTGGPAANVAADGCIGSSTPRAACDAPR